MQMTSRRTGAAAIVSLGVLACASSAAPAKPTPVEVWCGGDDGLTSRLRDAVEGAFKSSPDFTLSWGKKSGTLVVTIPTNVAWEQVGKRTRVLYNVGCTSAEDQKLGSSTGKCWDDDLSNCATQILKDAKTVARKIQTTI
jgi:hypothetical protein